MGVGILGNFGGCWMGRLCDEAEEWRSCFVTTGIGNRLRHALYANISRYVQQNVCQSNHVR